MRFTLAVGLLLTAFVVQFWATAFSVPLDFALAALFAFSLTFDWPELLFFIALTILVLDWQPLWSLPVLVCLFFPLLLYGIRRVFGINAWLALLIVVVIGVGALSMTAGLTIALSYWGAFLLDAAACFGFALLTFFVLAHFS